MPRCLIMRHETMRFDFDTWLMQTYGLRAEQLDEDALSLARKEYAEEYPQPGESEIRLKTYPFKRYLDSLGRGNGCC